KKTDERSKEPRRSDRPGGAAGHMKRAAGFAVVNGTIPRNGSQTPRQGKFGSVAFRFRQRLQCVQGPGERVPLGLRQGAQTLDEEGRALGAQGVEPGP